MHEHDPIEILMHEHRVIEKMIDVLINVTRLIEKGGSVDIEDLKAITDFISTFADKCHHGKEEGLLFPAMKNRGIPEEGGPIGVMLVEHEEGRAAVRGMREAIRLMAKSDATASKLFTRNAWRYVNLLVDHIQKEDNILYVMARDVLSHEDMQKLLTEFERVEKKDIGEGVHEKYIELVERLWKKYVSKQS